MIRFFSTAAFLALALSSPSAAAPRGLKALDSF
ncbi:hypothetical protein FHS79_003608, partial [Polymorphobacter multimanifer]|nr:hypothetical protein [Polymorphobacter multimanifer]